MLGSPANWWQDCDITDLKSRNLSETGTPNAPPMFESGNELPETNDHPVPSFSIWLVKYIIAKIGPKNNLQLGLTESSPTCDKNTYENHCRVYEINVQYTW